MIVSGLFIPIPEYYLNILMLYPDFGMLFTAAILSCHDMNILFMIMMPIAVLLLIASLILNMTMIFMPAAVSGYAYYFSWLFLTSSLFVIFLLLIIRCLQKDPMTLHLPDGKRTSGESYSFWLWICLPSISCGRLPWISNLFFHPSTVEITKPDFDVSSGNEDNYDYLSRTDEYGSSYTFHLPSQQYHACQNACESKENAVIEVTYLPHSKYLLQAEVKSTSLFLNVIIVQPGTLHR